MHRIADHCIFTVFALPRVDQKRIRRRAFIPLFCRDHCIFTVFALPHIRSAWWKVAPLSNGTANGNRDPARLPRQMAVFDVFIRFDPQKPTKKEGHFMRQISG